MASRPRKRSDMSKKVNNFIFQRVKTGSANTNEYYAFIDEYDFVDDNNNYRSDSEDSIKTLAKVLYREDSTKKLMIRVDHMYKPYNPASVYGDRTAYRGKDQTRPTSKFITVNQNAFNAYLNFLRTKNVSWLLNTEREMQ